MTPPVPARPSGLEKLAALLVAVCALAHLALVGHALAGASLTTDEFGTIFSYSAKGPGYVATRYNGPKNHILFNLANAVTPGRDSIAPVRARLYSFLATLGVVAVAATFALRTGRWLEAAGWLAAWTASAAALEMGLLARGYGFLALAAATTCLGAVRYFQTRRLGWAIALGALTVAGSYTIPGYLFFGAPFLLLLWLHDRRWPVFWIGVASALTILALYAPVLGSLLRETGDYSLKDERDFARWADVLRALRVYAVAGPDAFLLLWLAAAAMLPAFARRAEGYGPALRCLAGATFAFLLAMRALETPPLRMAAFAMLPLAFCVVVGAGDAIRRIRVRPIALVLGAGLAMWLALPSAFAVRAFRYVPLEDWSLGARLIDAAFPPEVAIDYGPNGKYLKYYLDPARPVVKNAAATVDSQPVIIVDAHRLWVDAARNEQRYFSARARSPRGIELVAPGAWRDLVVNFVAPALTPVTSTAPGRFQVEFPVNTPAHSALVAFERPLSATRVETRFTPTNGGPDESPAAEVLGNVVIVPLANRPGGSLRVEIKTDPQARVAGAALVPTAP